MEKESKVQYRITQVAQPHLRKSSLRTREHLELNTSSKLEAKKKKTQAFGGEETWLILRGYYEILKEKENSVQNLHA